MALKGVPRSGPIQIRDTDLDQAVGHRIERVEQHFVGKRRADEHSVIRRSRVVAAEGAALFRPTVLCAPDCGAAPYSPSAGLPTIRTNR